MKAYRPEEVREEDVHRIAHRDFGQDESALALGVLNTASGPCPRVRLAILKIANGNLDKLRIAAERAEWDPPSVTSEAESPNYSRSLLVSPRPDDTAILLSALADKKQYEEWLLSEKPLRI